MLLIYLVSTFFCLFYRDILIQQICRLRVDGNILFVIAYRGFEFLLFVLVKLLTNSTTRSVTSSSPIPYSIAIGLVTLCGSGFSPCFLPSPYRGFKRLNPSLTPLSRSSGFKILVHLMYGYIFLFSPDCLFHVIKSVRLCQADNSRCHLCLYSGSCRYKCHYMPLLLCL